MLYNDWRPQNFSEIEGQSNIVESLGFQSQSKHFSHAYIFHGHHGSGKTTIARILAKAVNCEHPTKDGACNSCEACRRIAENNTLDYTEIDGASNNGVDQIKEVISSTKFLPTSLGKKVYIIDEVHMLSISAFNALLKTLEEPPEYCIFILCTTELHKIPMTIRSRCESYFFRSIPLEKMIEKMIQILKEKKIAYETPALTLIAKHACGSMRDALSMLEQMITIASDGMKENVIRDRLSLIPEAVSLDIIYDIICYKTRDVLRKLEQMREEGKNLKNLLEQILLDLSQLIVFMTSKIGKDDYKYIAKKTNLQRLFWLMDQFSILREKIRNEIDPYMLFYLSLVKVSNPEILQEDYSYLVVQVAELKEKVKQLENSAMEVSSPNAMIPISCATEMIPEVTLSGEKGGMKEESSEPKLEQTEEDNHLSVSDTPQEERIESDNLGDLFDWM